MRKAQRWKLIDYNNLDWKIFSSLLFFLTVEKRRREPLTLFTLPLTLALPKGVGKITNFYFPSTKERRSEFCNKEANINLVWWLNVYRDIEISFPPPPHTAWNLWQLSIFLFARFPSFEEHEKSYKKFPSFALPRLIFNSWKGLFMWDGKQWYTIDVELWLRWDCCESYWLWRNGRSFDLENELKA